MLNRKTIAAIALVATGAAAPVLADDGDVRHAQILLEEAQTYGITGAAAGQTDASREDRMKHENLDASEKRWKQIARSQSYN